MAKRKRKKKKKTKLAKVRDWLAVWAHFRRSGPMKDRKKEKSKKHCRGKSEK